MTATLAPESLTVETVILATDAVPVSFGFHPYFGIPGLPRAQWRLQLPAMNKLLLDDHKIPTGKEEPCAAFDGLLADLDLDAGFVLLDEHPGFSLAGAGRRITIEFLENYRYAQIFAPRGKDFVALEPMTAPTSALTSESGLRLIPGAGQFRAAFRICVEDGGA